jgi:transposase-like protein
MKTLNNCLIYEKSDIAKFRLRALNHYYQYGWQAVASAFDLKKSTVYKWKIDFEKSRKRLISLVPKSTRPKHTRFMMVDPQLSEFIRTVREQYGNVSKYKLKILLDEFAKSVGLSSYGTSKINKIIVRNHYYFDTPFKAKRKRKLLSPRLKRSPRETTPGYIEMDSITLYVMERKYYFMTVIDVVTKFAWCTLVKSLSSKQAKKVLMKFMNQYQYPVRAVQTDNGSEFLKDFDKYLQQQNIAHHFIYPRSPRINGVVERFNRTIQDEFLSRSDELYYDLLAFEEKLLHYLNWYNAKRPHYSLKMQTPVAYLQQFL